MSAPVPQQSGNPGLDVTALRGMLARRRLATAHLPGRIRDHLAQHGGYLALSGGKDSVAALHLALQADPKVPVCFFDSGLEFPETLAYIRHLHRAWDLNLTWIKASPSALEILMGDGSWEHGTTAHLAGLPDLHTALIREPSRQGHEEHGPGEIWGVRSKESHGRRIAHIKALREEVALACHGCCPRPAPGQRESPEQRARHGGVIRRQDGTVAFSPVWDWSDADIWGYLGQHRIVPNPVYAKLKSLGVPPRLQRVSLMVEVNNLQFGRAVWLKRGWPRLYAILTQALPRLAEMA
ncbi:hypothetical protein BIV57_02085 [Mangrovactinospora gilvigrisea]|uniref:Phosphoadenosine phosphosulphate reductase domain-containing protein n=1 Tax=Mangrovactinospora gilvigrisea TaxID=1428644 RepID=A0A1J7BKD6_9ACTN|nr:phosphoadenosine phosphosulfate reductase family protein [Mangrovactinospora gilvigrisea]OIV39143.1 hypothetical protein BIV57_02085 [Mangrovactinospora gilvigrisea]